VTTGPRLGSERSAASADNAAKNDEEASKRSALELVAVVLLGIATVATAWCGYQSTQWNGRESDEARAAGFARLESSRLYGLATQKVSYDANVTTEYAAAVSEGNDKLAAFIRANLMRPDYIPYLDEWEAQVKAGSAEGTNLFTNKKYLEAQFADSEKKTAESDAALARSDEASKNGQDYVVMTLMTATALFFAGVTSSFHSRSARLILVTIAAAILAFTLVRLTGLPVA
jgi:hypothetical protein